MPPQQELLGKYHKAMGQVLQNKQLCTLLTAVMFIDWNTATHRRDTEHHTVQGKERNRTGKPTPEVLKAQFRGAGPSPHN